LNSLDHSDLLTICTFLIETLRNDTKVIHLYNHDRFGYKFDMPGSVRPKVNFDLRVQSLYPNNHRKYLVIFKKNLTVKPKLIVTLLFCHFKKKIQILVYSGVNCLFLKKTVKLRKMAIHMPFIFEMLELQRFNLVGERVVGCLKEEILVKACTMEGIVRRDKGVKI
jgi:hypothetical protein